MPTPNDPVLGLTGTLTMLQQQPGTAANMQPMGGGSEQDLARAAKSLESVQGNVAGQTMAIQQMATSSQQQVTQLSMLITQLGNQVSGLMQAVGQLSNSTRMSAMSSMMPEPAAPIMATTSAPSGPGFGAMALGGMGLAGRGLYGLGSFMGGIGHAAASPFFGAPIAGPGAGQVAPRMSGDVGFMRAFGIGSGLGMHPSMMKQSNATAISQLGRERVANRFADSAIGILGGGAHLGAALGGEAIGGAMATYGLGMGGITGGIVGGVLGMPIAATAGIAIDQVAGQAAAARGFGEQFGRGAFRYMPSSAMGMGSLRRPGMMQRLRVGQGMNRMAIEDLTFNEQDVGEMFAGVQQQDLLRGVSSVEEVVRRFRQTKETFKLIGRTMGQGIQEAAQTMGALQEIGVDPTGARGRAAIFGASSVMGMTPAEAMAASSAVGRRYASAGLGNAMNLQANLSLGAGQSAMRLLSTEQQAALGGREGMQQATGQFMEAFMNSQLGQASVLAGSAGSGLGASDTIALAGRRASSDISRLVRLQMGGQKMKDKFLSAGGGMEARMRAMEMIRSQAKVFERGGLDRRTAMILSMQQIAKQGGLELTDFQAEAQLKILENTPDEIRSRQREMSQRLAETVHNDTAEQTALMARAGRAFRQTFTPAAEAVGEGATRLGADVASVAEGIEERITGRRTVSMGRGINMEAMRVLRGRGRAALDMEAVPPEPVMPTGGGAEARGVYAAATSRRNAIIKRNEARQKQIDIASAAVPPEMRQRYQRFASRFKGSPRIEEIKQLLKSSASPEEKRAAMNEALELLSNGTYSMMAERGAHAPMRAIQDAAAELLDVAPSAYLTGTELAGGASFTSGDYKALSSAREMVRDSLGLGSRGEAAAFMAPEIQAVIADLDATGGISPANLERAERAGLGAQVGQVQALFEKNEWTISGDTRFERLKKGIAAGSGLQEAHSTALRIQGIGGQAAMAITGLRKRGLGGGLGSLIPRLGSLNVGEQMRAMGQLVTRVSDADLKALEASDDPGAQSMARVMREIRGVVDLSDGIDDTDRLALAGYLGQDPDSDFIKGINKAEDLGQVAIAALDVKNPASASPVTSVRARGALTPEQMETFVQMADNVRQTANMLAEIQMRMELKQW